ncbi:MAG: DMT family transporter [bacterium]|nr:DMT family transporter [bacterium]
MFGHEAPIVGKRPSYGTDGGTRWHGITHNPWIPIAIASLTWGSAPAATKAVLLNGVSPFTIFPLKQVGGALMVIAALALMGRLPRIDPATLKAGVVIGIFNMTVPTILFTLGFETIPASIGAVIVGIIPLTTILFTHWVVPGERFRAGRLPGLLMGMFGVAIMGWAPVGQPSSRWVLGVVLTTLGAACAGLGGAFTRRFAVRYQNRSLIVVQFITSAVLLSLISIPFDGYAGYLTIDAASLWLIVYMAAVPTVISFAAFMWASRIATAARAALIGYLVPVLGAMGGVALLSEPVTLQLIVGVVAVAVGVVFSDRPDREDDRRRAAARTAPPC